MSTTIRTTGFQLGTVLTELIHRLKSVLPKPRRELEAAARVN